MQISAQGSPIHPQLNDLIPYILLKKDLNFFNNRVACGCSKLVP